MHDDALFEIYRLGPCLSTVQPLGIKWLQSRSFNVYGICEGDTAPNDGIFFAARYREWIV